MRRQHYGASAAHGRAGAAGFTLLELVVVLAIMGLVAGIVISRGPQRSTGLSSRAAAGAVVQALRSARAAAIERSEDVSVAIDPVQHELAEDNGAVRHFAANMEVEVTGLRGPHAGAVRLIRFAPDGSSSGGAVKLGSGARAVLITVEWLTGRVKVDHAG